MRGWLREAAGGLPRQFWFLWTGTLINRLGAFAVIYLAIYLTQEQHFTQSQAGLVLGAYGVGGGIGTMTGGVLTDRWGRRPTMLTAQFGTAALMLALGFADGFWQLMLGAWLLGLFAEGVRPAFQAMMVDVVPDKDRVRAYSLNYWAVNLGFAGAAILAGFAAKFDYLLLFVVDAGTTLVTALISLIFLAETRPARAATRRTGGGPGLGTVFRDRVFLVFLGLNFVVVLVIMQHMSTLPIAMSADGLSPATFGWVIAANGIMIVAGQLFVPKLIDGRNRSRVLALATVIMGVGFGLTAFAGSPAFYAVTVVIWTLGEMLQSPSNSALVAELSPSLLRGRYQGVSSLSWSAGSALAPVVGGFVQQHAGNTVLWLSCAVIGVLVAAGQIFSGPARERRAAELRVSEHRPAGPSPAGPSPAGPSPAGPSPAGPSPAGPSPAATETPHAEDVTPPQAVRVPADG
ncbi:MDR family MFS transporter [Couchioplanes caeruleus]|uniref:MDR family MFS transporter n=1 Tax=Couchioplanes caeruleus TaxID=56438 RepID=UPI000A078A76|nr:MFS transporter [Couchioplanes caeruleus]